MPKLSKHLAEIKFFHGWAYQADCWKGWQAAINPARSLIECYDRGYFGKPQAVSPFAPGEHPKVVIAHSLGLHFISNEILDQAGLIVLIGSFKSFHEFSADLHASLVTTRAMRNRLKKNAIKVLRDFYEQSGDVSNYSFDGQPDVERLSQDLLFLDRVHYDVNLHPVEASTLLLHGAADAVSSPLNAKTLSDSLPQASLCVHPTGNHALPFTESDWCLKQLEKRYPEVFALDDSRAVSHAR